MSYVWRYPYTIVNPHFAQQSALCAGTPPGAAPWRVLRIEEVETWYEELVCSLGIAHAVRTGWTKFDPASRSRAWWARVRLFSRVRPPLPAARSGATRHVQQRR